MTLAMAALFADGPSRLRNIASWRVKETDRLAAMATELRKVGAQVEEGPDYLVVAHASLLRFAPDASIDTYDDHRMAMCFALVPPGGRAGAHQRPKCVAKTFPDFFDRFGEDCPAQRARSSRSTALRPPARERSRAGVAETLGFHFLDSGALYRLVALAALRAGVDPSGRGRPSPRSRAALEARFEGEAIYLADESVTDAIRAEAVSAAASQVAALPACARPCSQRQRAFRQAAGAGGGRPRHGLGGFPRRPAQGISDGQFRGTRASAAINS